MRYFEIGRKGLSRSETTTIITETMTAANALTLAIEEGRHGGGSLFRSVGS